MRAEQQVIALLSLLACCEAAPTWELHQHLNCYHEHGSYVPDSDPFSLEVAARSVDECKALCEANADGNKHSCAGITVQNATLGNVSQVRCWRRPGICLSYNINISQCDNTEGYNTWTISGTRDTYPAVKWSRSAGVSCYEGHGAKDLEIYKGAPLGRMTFPECKAMCNYLPDCEGIVVEFEQRREMEVLWRDFPLCYRRSNIDLKSCVSGAQQAWAMPYDTWVKVKSDDASPMPISALAEESDTDAASCSQLFNYSNCWANNKCRWCLVTSLNEGRCVSQDFADRFLGSQVCDSPKPDPCDSYTSKEDCRNNGCSYCHYTAGHKEFEMCHSEIPRGMPGYCESTLDHVYAYKPCGGHDSGICSDWNASWCKAPVCALCQFRTWTDPSNSSLQEACVDKDSVGSWCTGNSRSQSLMI